MRLNIQRGAVTAELTVATSLLLFLLLAIVQYALWSHATHIAQSAAAQGLAAARAYNGSVAEGRTAAQQVLNQLGDGPLSHATVDVRRDAATVTVRIDGTASPVVPALHLPVHAEAAGEAERFVAP